MATAKGMLKKVPIGALQLGNRDVIVVAIIINKPDPRIVTMKKDGRERCVMCLTLRDSPSDLINMTVWSSKEMVEGIHERFHLGDVVEIIRPRISRRDFNSAGEKYSPMTTSPLQLQYVDDKTVISHQGNDLHRFTPLMRIPTKAVSTFLKIADIISNSKQGKPVGHYVDLLAAVRSVSPIKTYQRQGQEKCFREVRLFDETSDSLHLKMWDSEMVAMSNAWIPRQDILHVADARVDWDEFRGTTLITCTSKTIITNGVEFSEASELAVYAETADFSTISKMDQFISTVDPMSISRVVNVSMLVAMCEDVYSDNEMIITSLLYGFITRFDADIDGDAVALVCGQCGGAREQACVNMDCSNYNNAMGSSRAEYKIRVDISDETGTWYGCAIHRNLLDKILGPPEEFGNLSQITKTGYKLQVFLKPVKLSLVVMRPSTQKQNSRVVIIDLKMATLAEKTSRMPSPFS